MTRAPKAPNSLAHFGSLVTDLAWAWAIFCGILLVTDTPPVFRARWVPALLAAFAIYQVLPRLFSRRTLGGALWRFARLGSRQAGIAILLTFASIWPAAWLTHVALLSHPYWLSARAWELQASLPASDWSVLPFYYTMGAWPTTYDGNPIFHALPYEKGPPEKFPGRVIARWNPPHTTLTLEGPKTPDTGISAPDAIQSTLRGCFAGAATFDCARLREKVLGRHVGEIENQLGHRDGRLSWSVRWLQVRNPAVPAAEEAQGIYLSARNRSRGQDRFILITRTGSHQSFILDYPTNAPAEMQRATATFHQSLQSLRASGELNPGRAWTDRRLQDTRLSELRTLKDPEQLTRRLAEIQALLISKVTVDPRTYETYFHLGGIGLTLLQYSQEFQDRVRAAEWMAVAKPQIQSAYRFARDVNPEDPRTQRLESFWIEAQKR